MEILHYFFQRQPYLIGKEIDEFSITVIRGRNNGFSAIFFIYGATNLALEAVSSIFMSLNYMKFFTVVGEKKDNAAISGKIDEAYKFRFHL